MATAQQEQPVMLAAVVERFNEPYNLRMVPRPPQPTGFKILIRVLAASYCHTDSIFASGGLSQSLPRVGCHEFSGEVISLGHRVSPDHLPVGTIVGVPGRAFDPCGQCFECANPDGDAEGYSVYCPRAGNLGLTRDGGFQEYCIVDSRQIAPLPAGMAPTQAAPLMCAGLTVWTALQRGRDFDDSRTVPSPGAKKSKVAIIGAGGGLGHLGVQFAAHLGREVWAIDANDRALDLVRKVKRELGAAGESVTVLDARAGDAETLRGKELDGGVDQVILLPESQAAFDMGMRLVSNHGAMVVLSFPREKLRFDAHDVVFRDIRILGSLVGRNHQLRAMLDFAVKHSVRADVKTYPFRDINRMVEEAHGGDGSSAKCVVDMSL